MTQQGRIVIVCRGDIATAGQRTYLKAAVFDPEEE